MSELAERTVAVDELDDLDRPELMRLVDEEPFVNAMLAARLRSFDSVRHARFGGRLLGVRGAGVLTGAVFSGANLVPVGGADADWAALAHDVAARGRSWSSLVGRTDAVQAMWPILERRWGSPRAVRAEQPLLIADHPPAVPLDIRVRPVRPDEIEQYLPAAVEMFTEELGVSPRAASARTSYRQRVESLIASRRAFAIVESDGCIAFKADIGALSAHTAQLHGVWVRPDLRGRGIGTAALAAVIEHALTRAPTVSLYVNDFNLAARRTYARLGMRQVATLTTVLL